MGSSSEKGRVNTRQSEIFPLATTTVGWVLDRTPGGPKRSGGLGAKRRVVRAGCRLRMKLREKMHTVIYPENKICAGSKTGFFTLLSIVCTDQKTTSAIAVLVVAVVDFFSVTVYCCVMASAWS